MIEEVENMEMPPPAIETIIHHAGIEIRKIPVGNNETMTLLRLHTPFQVVTLKLNDEAVEAILAGLKRSSVDIIVARPGDVPGLR